MTDRTPHGSPKSDLIRPHNVLFLLETAPINHVVFFIQKKEAEKKLGCSEVNSFLNSSPKGSDSANSSKKTEPINRSGSSGYFRRENIHRRLL